MAGFALILFQLIPVALIGGALGTGAGQLVSRYVPLASVVVHFLRVGAWIPVFLLWVLPVPTSWGGAWKDASTSILLITIAAVALVIVRNYIIAKSIFRLEENDVRRFLYRSALLHALFLCVLSQPILSVHGWKWASVGGARGFLVTVLIALTVFAIHLAFRLSLEVGTAICARVLLAELYQDGRKGAKGAVLFGLLFFGFVWQALTIFGFPGISSPTRVLSAAYALFANDDIWIHVYVSNLEIFAGLAVTVVCGTVCTFMLSHFSTLRNFLAEALPLTFVIPIIALLTCAESFHQFDIWPKIVGVGLVTFFPFLLSFWRLSGWSYTQRILLGMDNALPFAFVAMLSGEFMASKTGLGFSLARASAVGHDLSEPIAIVLLVIGIMTILSWLFRSIAKHLQGKQT